MNDSPQAGLLQWDRFTGIWLALVGLLLVAALVTAWVGGEPGIDDMIPAYSRGDTVEDFIYNAYLAHLRGDLARLQSMYAADTWAAMASEDKNWERTSLFAAPDVLGMRILDTTEGPDGLQALVAYYHAWPDGQRAIRHVEVSTRFILLEPAGDSWKLRQLLPRSAYGY